MKKIIIFSLFLDFVFSTNLSLAQSYPSSCPVEAQAILSATSGCSGIDSAVYTNIYNNCCVKAVSASTTIIYVIVLLLVVALAIWQIFKRRKKNIIN